MKLLKEILIVEDDEIIANLIEFILKKRDYIVCGKAGTGEEAIHLVAEHLPDLVLMDINLNGAIDGIDAARYIFSLFNTPVIFLSGQNTGETLQRVQSAESYGFLTKPFKETEMMVNIEIALHNHAMMKKVSDIDEKPMKKIMTVLDGVIITDKRGRILFVNPYAEHLLNIPRKQVILKPLSRLMILSDLRTGEKLADPVDGVIRESMAIGMEHNVSMQTAGGLRKNITIRATPLNDRNNEMIGVFVRIHEKSHTERKISE
jgi:Response regulator containing CheY-like receiver, AAA-type ATPase, and DNA-binding domains